MSGHKEFSDKQIRDIRQRIDDRERLVDVAERYGCSARNISAIARGESYRGSPGPIVSGGYITRAGRRALSDHEAWLALEEYWHTDDGTRSLARRYGISRSAMQRLVQRKTYRHIDFPIMSDADRRQVAVLHDDGRTATEIADLYQMPISIVAKIIKQAGEI